MTIGRRTFIGTAVGAGFAAAQTPNAPAPAKAQPAERKAQITRLFKSPDAHPNALEATPDGLWIGDQVSERVFKVDWENGKVLKQFETEAHNTSGLAVGAGSVWISCNGSVSNRRPARAHDKDIGEILQADMNTGKTIKITPVPWGAGIHGMTFNPKTQTLWATALSVNTLVEMDPKDLRIIHMIPIRNARAHGFDFEGDSIWLVEAQDRMLERIDPKNGKVLEVVRLTKTDPDPHGLAIHNGHMYYCDAGLTDVGTGSAPGYICRVDLI